MQQLKKYNPLHVIAGHWFLFGVLTLLYPVWYMLAPDTFLRGWAFAVCTFISVAYFIAVEYKNVTPLVSYMKQHQPALYKKYDMNLRVYVRNFSNGDIETMLQTPVSAAFIQCYNLPVKLATCFLYFFVLYGIPAAIVTQF